LKLPDLPPPNPLLRVPVPPPLNFSPPLKPTWPPPPREPPPLNPPPLRPPPPSPLPNAGWTYNSKPANIKNIIKYFLNFVTIVTPPFYDGFVSYGPFSRTAFLFLTCIHNFTHQLQTKQYHFKFVLHKYSISFAASVLFIRFAD
jgi:hypothetical protein